MTTLPVIDSGSRRLMLLGGVLLPTWMNGLRFGVCTDSVVEPTRGAVFPMALRASRTTDAGRLAGRSVGRVNLPLKLPAKTFTGPNATLPA